MSIPPNNYPSNNFSPNSGYGAPPPKPASGTGWKIAGFGCLGLFLLAAIGGVMLVRNVKNKMANPSKNDIVGVAILAGQAGLDGARLRQAIVTYHTQHGSYPKSLMDLYSDGSIDGKLLHNGLDDSPDPAHLSWRYYPPAEGAPGNTPILEESYHITMGNATQPGKLVISLDGRSQGSTGKSAEPTDAGGQTP